MAGTGFLLRKLASQNNFLGLASAFFHSMLATVGPWILIVVSFYFISEKATDYVGLQEMREFLAIVIYNFLFSLVFSAGVYMIAARFVSDCLFQRDALPIPGILIGSLLMITAGAMLSGVLFFVFYASMSASVTILSLINYVFLCQVWVIMLFLSSIRNYRWITLSWIVGMGLTVFLSIYLGRAHGTIGLLTGMNIGIAVIVFSMLASILAEYPDRYRLPIEFPFYFRRYKGLFWGGLFLFAGMWVDKVLMWHAPEAEQHLNQLPTYPIYDGAMAISYLTIIPAMAIFFFSLETNFLDSYIQYIQSIERNAPLATIENEKNHMIDKIMENGRVLMVLQGSFSLLMIALSANLLSWGNFDFLYLPIFRLGTIGSFFAVLNLLLVILFSYFDSQKNIVKITAFMFFSNAGLTLISRHMGFAFYGYGYCFSMILTFLLGALLLASYLKRFTYHIFISNVIKRHSVRALDSP